MAANRPFPAGLVPSRLTAARGTPGAISLSISSHFALMPYSNRRKTGGIAARPSQALTKPAPTGSIDIHEHDRHGAGRSRNAQRGRAVGRQDDVRGECDQFLRIFAMWSASLAAPTVSIRTLRPALQPDCCSPCKTQRDGPALPDRPPPDASARRCAASVPPAAPAPQPAMQPPHRRVAVMNSRRFTRSPRRRERAGSAVHQAERR